MIGDFNVKESEETLEYFLNSQIASNIVKNKISFKSLNNPSYFKLIQTIATSCITDCHNFVTTILKAPFKKALPKGVFYRYYEYFKVTLMQWWRQ